MGPPIGWIVAIMSKTKPVLSLCAGLARSETDEGMPDTTSRAQRSRPARTNTAIPLPERIARNGDRGPKGSRPLDDVTSASPPDWPEGFEPADVLKGYLDGLADTPNHSRRDAAYWYGHLNALADRQPGKGPAMDMTSQERWH